MRNLIIMVFFQGALCVAMADPDAQQCQILLSDQEKITGDTLARAARKLDVWPMCQTQDGAQMLNETLFILARKWQESWGQHGIALAAQLLAKGAQIYFQKEFNDEVAVGESGPFKMSETTYYQTPGQVASGSLKKYFEEHSKNKN